MEQKSKQQNLDSQSGQSLIETLAAIFVLTMALTTGLGLAVYAFSHTAESLSEITASNLAREGVDVVRMMRDSNWLASDAKNNGGWELQPCSDIGGKLCYPKAYQKAGGVGGYDLFNKAGNNQLSFNPNDGSWSLGNGNYNLYLQADGTFTSNNNGSSVNFARMVNLTFVGGGGTAYPSDNSNSNQELVIKSVVVWKGKSCTPFDGSEDLLALATPCKVIVEEHLTNWKDYR